MPNAQSLCSLNVVPIQFNQNAKILVGVQPYESSVQLSDLRAKHRGTHLFKRFSVSGKADVIASVSLLSGTDPIGNKIVGRKLSEISWFIGPLVMESLLNFFSRQDR